MKIYVKELVEGCFPVINKTGDCFDVKAAKDVRLTPPQAGTQYIKDGKKFRDVSFDHHLVPLGIVVEIPEGFKANLYPRSSSYKHFGFTVANSVGQIDSSYKGPEDEWKLSIIPHKTATIKKGDRIAQFEIVPSSKATIWQKVKWFFSNKIEFVKVDEVSSASRGGFGSTGR